MPSYDHSADEELFVLLKAGNVAAFEQLYHRYWARLYTAAYKRVKSREAAEEIVQDIFTMVWAGRDGLNINTSVSGYFFSAVRYRVFNLFHKQLVRENHIRTQVEQPSYSNDTEDTILFEDLASHYEQQVANLPERCRQVFELSRKEFKSNREIAIELNLSEKTVENHLTKALRILRNGLRYHIALLLFWFN